MPNVNYSTWMTDLPDDVRSRPMSRLAIPGTHNSFTYSIMKSSPLGPDNPKWLKNLGKFLKFIVKPVLYKWSVCQSLDTEEQLRRGVRYFDFRVARMQRSSGSTNQIRDVDFATLEDVKVLHALVGYSVGQFLIDINEFLNRHPSEVVILDFQHTYDFKRSDYDSLSRALENIFGSKICPALARAPSLRYMQRNKHQVIIVNGQLYLPEARTRMFWPRKLCPNPWADTTNTKKLKKFLTDGLENRDQRKFFVSQGILTPKKGTIARRPFTTLEKALVRKWNPEYMDKWLPEAASNKDTEPNIILADFIELDSVAETVVNLNFKPETPKKYRTEKLGWSGTRRSGYE